MNMHSSLATSTPMLPINERALAALRALGRMGTVQGTILHALLTPDLHASTSRLLWQQLTERKLIWQAGVPNRKTNATGQMRGPQYHVYGLTDEGRALIDSLGAEPHDGTFERLIYRPKQAPVLPSTLSLVHDTYLSNWCASLLDQVRRTPMLVGAHVQRRYAVTDASGATVQTLGAAVVLAFDPKQTTFERAPWVVPWLSMGVPSPAWTIVRLAIEVDSGQSAPRALFAMAQTYATLTQTGGYRDAPLGGTPRPVLITLPGRRFKAVADVWMEAWPGSPAILSSVEKTTDPNDGVLWGQYMSLKTNPLQPTNLLGNLLGTVEEWPTRTKGWQV